MTTTTELDELTGDYVLDPASTRIGFVARHTVGGRVRGRFGEFEGSARLDGADPSKSSARLTIRAASIQTGNPQRDRHLSAGFLGADDHPAISFTSTEVQKAGRTGFKVTGALTIRGVTKPVTLDVELTGAESDPSGGVRVGFAGSVTVSRKAWGVNWNAATTAMVSDKVTLEFEVAAVRRS
ncbi:YceI family protein [Nonomuraea zeae]|uniref:YceI family protein n=1 Tax=Nonomuraea zeae TaxID=1642303 RepID=A0A5S4GBS8_9ACTN|nr:YceI family protein [Nonomuraea zeae]TMR30468.1 YceI family protein [Nonomuraea zeae]